MQVPLHNLELSSEIVSGSVVVGLRPSLPVPGVSLILGNDIAGGKVEANPCVSDTPSCDVSDPVETVTELFPSCAVTHAMAKANAGKDDEPGDDMFPAIELQDIHFTRPRIQLSRNRPGHL